MGKTLEKVKDVGTTAGMIITGGVLVGIWAVTLPISLSFATYNYITKNHRSVKNPDKISLPREVKHIARNLDKNGKIEVRLKPLRKEVWDFEAYRGYNVNYVQGDKTINLAKVTVNGENMDEFYFPASGWHYEITALFPTTETLFLKVPKHVDIKYDINWERQILSSYAAKFGINTKLLQSENLAYRTALSIANQVSKYSRIAMIDYSEEDRKNLESRFN